MKKVTLEMALEVVKAHEIKVVRNNLQGAIDAALLARLKQIEHNKQDILTDAEVSLLSLGYDLMRFK